MSREAFELAYRRWCDEHGESYDPWDIAAAWKSYLKNPELFDYLETK